MYLFHIRTINKVASKVMEQIIWLHPLWFLRTMIVRGKPFQCHTIFPQFYPALLHACFGTERWTVVSIAGNPCHSTEKMQSWVMVWKGDKRRHSSRKYFRAFFKVLFFSFPSHAFFKLNSGFQCSTDSKNSLHHLSHCLITRKEIYEKQIFHF